MISEQREVRPGWQELGRYLLRTAAMSSDWALAFAAVDRAAFLPDVMWPHDPDAGDTAVSRAEDSHAWYGYADRDVPITTQWDDGEHTGREPGLVPTSSASMPSVVMAMLRDLDVKRGMRVLEIGTGTGWSAGLLTHRLGRGNVVTLEVDPDVADTARASLHGRHLFPMVLNRDGLAGDLPGSPYDRVIATCGLRHIPDAWIEQSTPGGIILAPWGTAYSNQDALVRLVVADDGKSASGRLLRPLEFMKARAQRGTWPQHAAYVPADWRDTAERGTTQLKPDDIDDGKFGTTAYVLGLIVTDIVHAVHTQADGTRTAWFYGLSDRSWAVAAWPLGQDPEVYQDGPRRLWTQVEGAWEWWDSRGRPGIGRFGLTVDTEGEHTVWLDNPDIPVPAAL